MRAAIALALIGALSSSAYAQRVMDERMDVFVGPSTKSTGGGGGGGSAGGADLYFLLIGIPAGNIGVRPPQLLALPF